MFSLTSMKSTEPACSMSDQTLLKHAQQSISLIEIPIAVPELDVIESPTVLSNVKLPTGRRHTTSARCKSPTYSATSYTSSSNSISTSA